MRGTSTATKSWPCGITSAASPTIAAAIPGYVGRTIRLQALSDDLADRLQRDEAVTRIPGKLPPDDRRLCGRCAGLRVAGGSADRSAMTASVAATDPATAAPTVPEDHVLVLFGATGDLAQHKLLPGLFHLAVAGMMPERYRIVGSGRLDGAPDAEGFVAHVRGALRAFGRHELSDENWKPFAERLSFAAASAEEPDARVQALARAEQELGGQDVRRLVYLAVPPEAFGPMVSMIGATGLGERARLIVEKPFGHDLASARALNQTLHAVLDEAQIFRIDHFLGKEAVQNTLAFRFTNGLFEPVWNRRHVDYVQIDVPEQLTIEGRARFFEQTGTFRDAGLPSIWGHPPPVRDRQSRRRRQQSSVHRRADQLA